MAHTAPGDVGRRVAHRRRQLGLSREEVAETAGMAPGYLQYVEEHPADVSDSALLRLANALQTTLLDLRGGQVDLPPGRARAAARPALEQLDEDVCWHRLSGHGVGRVAMALPDGPVVLPVNYTVAGRSILFRTAPDTATAEAVGHEIAFEVDRIDEALSQGWSVLVVGRAEAVDNPAEADGGPEPWVDGARTLWIRLRPERISGRIIRVR